MIPHSRLKSQSKLIHICRVHLGIAWESIHFFFRYSLRRERNSSEAEGKWDYGWRLKFMYNNYWFIWLFSVAFNFPSAVFGIVRVTRLKKVYIQEDPFWTLIKAQNVRNFHLARSNSSFIRTPWMLDHERKDQNYCECWIDAYDDVYNSDFLSFWVI